MSTKSKNPLSGMHTAGIFSDMSVDGPEIGTLVIIVDRAKNLPNRKTIGKQDPYCAARLGKEAKKTATDVRGGQTPKWDQELRFTVHDSPDYYQLKLSVFNDDKRTELIGESWIDLRDIILPGGGQNDQWQTLNCRGKYAGEIRIEITYYDSRPKPEKPAVKPRPVVSGIDQDVSVGSLRAPVKRRPLPSSPGSIDTRVKVEAGQIPPGPRPLPSANPVIPLQSPLQALEYNTPPPARFNPAESYSTPELNTRFREDALHPRRSQEGESWHGQDRAYEMESRSTSGVGGPRQPGQSPVDGRPPPPPAHRVRNGSGGAYDLSRGVDVSPHTPMRHDVLRNEAQRSVQTGPSPSSASSYPGRPVYRPYESAPDMSKQLTYEDPSFASQQRHHSYDPLIDPHQRSLQPTVEDVPESWTPPTVVSRQRSSTYQSQCDELGFGSVPSPAPLNLSGRGSAASNHYTTPSPVSSNRQYPVNELASPLQMVARDYQGQSGHTYSHSYSNSESYVSHDAASEGALVRSGDYSRVPVPPTLMPGVDPVMSLELAARINEGGRHERRYTQPSSTIVPTRGRQGSEPPMSYVDQSSSHGYPAGQPREYGVVAYSGRSRTPTGSAAPSNPRRLSVSPNPNHTIRRKSVSPAPPPEARRLSGVPFSPDSYDELNPSVASAREDARGSEYTNSYGKIVTADGREVDPSDHLPMDTWAPEPEPKQPKSKSAPEPSSRIVPAGTQPMPSSGRRQIRITTRPQSMAVVPTTYMNSDMDPSPPPGRNRLQKKNYRVSALPAPVSAGSSPLGPATAGHRNSTPPRALVRAGAFDYENYGSPYDGYGAARASYGNGPPIPAKVPLMSGGLGPAAAGNGNEDWALMDEMSRIDIGSGRSRRHGGY